MNLISMIKVADYIGISSIVPQVETFYFFINFKSSVVAPPLLHTCLLCIILFPYCNIMRRVYVYSRRQLLQIQQEGMSFIVTSG